MRGFVYEAPGKGGICSLEKKAPGAKEVQIRVRYCGICGTDMNIWRGTDRAEKNIVLGHEFCGTIMESGKEITRFSTGDRVGVDPNIPCHSCEFCRNGRINLCSNLKALGVDINGGFEEFCIVPEDQLYKIPDRMSWEDAALMEPVACALNGIERAGIRIGDDVLILGGGPMGLLMVQLAAMKGAGRVILCEKTACRRKIGREVGADIVLEDLERYAEICGPGPDVVIECIGKPETQEKALEIVKKGGRAVLFGDGDMNRTYKIPSQLFYAKELTVSGAALNPFTHEAARRIISSGKMRLKPMVSSVISLDELPGVLTRGYGPEDIKILVAP